MSVAMVYIIEIVLQNAWETKGKLSVCFCLIRRIMMRNFYKPVPCEILK